MTAQFLGAFNDNAFKILIALLAIRMLSQEAATQFISLIGALFIVPFIMFSPYAGFCADRFTKRSVIVVTKIAEIVIMTAGLIALMNGNLVFAAFVLFLMTTQSAFFSPAKYGILPEILDEENLSKGNGFLQMWTFLAIILGSAFGGQMSHMFHGNAYRTSYVLIFLAAVGTVASLFIERHGCRDATNRFKVNSFKESIGAMREIKQDRWLFLTLIAICYFWFLGSVFQMNALVYGKNTLHLTDGKASLLLVMTSIGVGLGSLLAGYLSEKKVEYGLVPLGAMGVSFSSVWIGFNEHAHYLAFVQFLLLGCFSGVYIVPLNAYFQLNSPGAKRGRYLAASNIITSFCILLGSAYIWLFGVWLRLNPAQLFFILGILSIGITLFILKTLPEAFLRLFNWIFARLFYKIKVVGLENLPKQGGALLVCNHISYADPTLILASAQRSIRFLMFREIYEHPMIHPIARAMKVIPVSFKDRPKAILQSLSEAKKAIQEGDLVCIFAEAGLTRHGNLLPFLKGFEHIMEGLDAPIIPMYLDRMWGSIFSYENGRYFWKWPRKWPYPTTISFGKAMPARSHAYQVRLAVQELSAEAFKLRGSDQKKLHVAFIDEAKKHPFKFCMADSSGKKMNCLQVLAGVLLISKKLFARDTRDKGDQEKVGVLLPSSCIGSLVNGAVLFSGKLPVNLNFTASRESVALCIEQCQMKRVITSRIFLKKAKLDEIEAMVFIEDLIGRVKRREKLAAFLSALFLPRFVIKKLYVKGEQKNVNDIATIIFSSGSTGKPKGVMLSHSNIFSNIEGLYQVLRVQDHDVILGVLPFFHSFGFTATLCMPVGVGLGVVYHSNPLDASTIGDLAQKYTAPILMRTPTFFAAYVRKCTKEQFASLRYAVVGAEKLRASLAESFYEKFGIVPYEGYGATELSPIVSMSFPDYESEKEKIRQVGHKEGKVGHPIPGVAVKVVNPETFEALLPNEEGLLLVKGPNVMRGYLNQPEQTRQAVKDGWYLTGDIATIDEEGFICITDRLSRFSKIGGEMIPHIKIEELLHQILNESEQVCAVTSLPDEKKGEKLIVLHTKAFDIEEAAKKLAENGLPPLWIPKRENFYRIDSLPLLGSGKLDLKGLKHMAANLSGGTS